MQLSDEISIIQNGPNLKIKFFNKLPLFHKSKSAICNCQTKLTLFEMVQPLRYPIHSPSNKFARLPEEILWKTYCLSHVEKIRKIILC